MQITIYGTFFQYSSPFHPSAANSSEAPPGSDGAVTSDLAIALLNRIAHG